MQPPAVEARQPWHKRAWVWAATLLGLLGWVLVNGPTAIDNSQILPSKTERLYNKLVGWIHTDSAWTAKWSNEGDITAPVPYAFVDLDTFVYGDDVSGTITSTKFPPNFPLEFMLIEGTRTKDNKLAFEVYDYVSGARVHFATMEAEQIEAAGTPTIRVKTIWQSSPIFPTQFELWRIGDSKMFNDESAKLTPNNSLKPTPLRGAA